MQMRRNPRASLLLAATTPQLLNIYIVISYKIEENKGETWKHRNHKLYITNIVATNTVTNDCNS